MRKITNKDDEMVVMDKPLGMRRKFSSSTENQIGAENWIFHAYKSEEKNELKVRIMFLVLKKHILE